MRLFTALALDEDVTDALLAIMSQSRSGPPGVRWLARGQLHITLQFIGEVSTAVARQISNSLRDVRFAPFTLRIRGVGMFGSKARPRVLWAGVEDCPEVINLFNNIVQATEQQQIKTEKKPFKPHITLARLRGRPVAGLDNYLHAHRDFSIAPYRVREFTLFRSHLEKDGARHEVIERYPAKG